MSKKYQNKYRIASARLPNWDYGWNAAYFVTICTKERICYFGDVLDGVMQLSEIGKMADQYWLEIPDRFLYAKLGPHVVMPNHVHGIVIIDKPDGIDFESNTEIKGGGITGNKNPMLHDNLSRIIRWYKGRVTYEARRIPADFAWQSRFHDHIIRNDQSFHNISKYIVNNPLKWWEDKFFSR